MNKWWIISIVTVVLVVAGVFLWYMFSWLGVFKPKNVDKKNGVSNLLTHLSASDQASCLSAGCKDNQQTCYNGRCCSTVDFLGGLIDYLENGGIAGFMQSALRSSNSDGVAPVDVVAQGKNYNLGVYYIHVRVQFYLSPYIGIPGDIGDDCDSSQLCTGFKDSDSNGCTFTASTECDKITECKSDLSHCVGNPDVCIPWTSDTDSCNCSCKKSYVVEKEPTWEIVGNNVIAYPASETQYNDGYGVIIAATMSLENFAFWGYITGNASNGLAKSGMYFHGKVVVTFPQDKGLGITLALNTDPSNGLITVLGIGLNSGEIKVDTTNIDWKNEGDLGDTVAGQITDTLRDSVTKSISKQITGFNNQTFLPPEDLEGIIDSALSEAISPDNVEKFFKSFILPISVTTNIDPIGSVTISVDPDSIPDLTVLKTVVNSTITVGVKFNTAVTALIVQDSTNKSVCPLLSLTKEKCSQIPAGTTLSWEVSLDGLANDKPQPFWVVLKNFNVDSPSDTLVTDALKNTAITAGIQASFDILMSAFYGCQPVTEPNECSETADCAWLQACANGICVCANDVCPRLCSTTQDCDTYYNDNAVGLAYLPDKDSGGITYNVTPYMSENDEITTYCNPSGVCSQKVTSEPVSDCTDNSVSQDCPLFVMNDGVQVSSISNSGRYGKITTAIPTEAAKYGMNWDLTCVDSKCNLRVPKI
jgi:hypothetical protein